MYFIKLPVREMFYLLQRLPEVAGIVSLAYAEGNLTYGASGPHLRDAKLVTNGLFRYVTRTGLFGLILCS